MEIKTSNAATLPNTLIINDRRIDPSKGTINRSRGNLIQLRAVIEELGGKVSWNAEEQNVMINYRERQYEGILEHGEAPACACSIRPNISFFRYNQENANKKQSVLLHSMGVGGYYEMINGSIYLSAETMKYLLNDMGISMTINLSTNTITIKLR